MPRAQARLTKSRCQFGTFLYVIREVTSNMMIAHCPWMLRVAEAGAKPVSCVCLAATALLVFWFEVARSVLVSVTKAAKLLLRAGEATTGVRAASKRRQAISAAESTCPAVSHTLKTSCPRLVWNSSGWTSTPRVAGSRHAWQ